MTSAHEKAGRGGDSYQFAVRAAELAANTRCSNVVVLDLRGRSPVTEFFVIATGTSAVQIRTVADEISDLGAKVGFKAWHTSGYEGAKWVVVDAVNVVVHVFDQAARDFYDLEVLWGDAQKVDWRAELGLPPAPAEEPRLAARMAAAAGQDIADADDEEARLEGRDPEAEEEGDADIDEDAETDAPVVVELPDLSTGSNSVEFVEIDPPTTRRGRGKAVFPTPLKEEDEDGSRRGKRRVARTSRDEDDAERAAEKARDADVEAVSDEDLPDDQLEREPMGGVSASMSSTLIEEDDEEQQREALDLDDAEHDHKDEIPPAHEAAAENVTIRRPDAQGPGIDISTEPGSIRPTRRHVPNRRAMRGPEQSAPTGVDPNKARGGVVKGKAARSRDSAAAGGAQDDPTPQTKPVRRMGKAGARQAAGAGVATAGRRKGTTSRPPTGKGQSRAKKPSGKAAAAGAARAKTVKKAAAKKPAAKKAGGNRGARKAGAAKAGAKNRSRR